MDQPGTATTSVTRGLDALDPADFFDGSPIATFVVNSRHLVTHYNQACATLLGVPAESVIGTSDLGKILYGVDRPIMADLIVDGSMESIVADLYENRYRNSLVIPDAYEAEGFFPNLGTSGRWLFFTAAPLRDEDGVVVGAIETLQDITERKVAESALMKAQLEVEDMVTQRTAQLAEVNDALRQDVVRRESVELELLNRNLELSALNDKLSTAQEHLVQSEKLASIGLLAAGVAHEINNPIGYVFSNFGMLEEYLEKLFQMLRAYEMACDVQIAPEALRALQAKKLEMEIDFLKEDIPNLMRESKEGIARVRKIVQDLKDFSHVDAKPQWQFADLNRGIESTLNVVNNEVKYKADVVKEYGDIPEVQCMPSEINQVVMNLVVNAAHAIGPNRGKIYIRSGVGNAKLQGAADLKIDNSVWIEIADTGSGIPKDVVPRIFDPFFTTKPVGKGTGLGLSLSYGIIQKHHGRIEVDTEVGKGTTFRITLPLVQSDQVVQSKETKQ
ncbi:ATP-binding protein [Rhodoferax sp. GW822-FHT02A01]|uniref:ATP-binding protein n=1 Tax=Rhodoferax sp. GW822-FHT02A01 TaxID=3141537 RepID=UPI00315DC578